MNKEFSMYERELLSESTNNKSSIYLININPQTNLISVISRETNKPVWKLGEVDRNLALKLLDYCDLTITYEDR